MTEQDPNAEIRAFLYVLTKAAALVLAAFASTALFRERYFAFAIIALCTIPIFYFWRIYIFSVKLLTGETRSYTPVTLRDDAVRFARSREGTIRRWVVLAIGLICWGVAALTEYHYVEWVILELFAFAAYLVLGFFSLRKLPNLKPHEDESNRPAI